MSARVPADVEEYRSHVGASDLVRVRVALGESDLSVAGETNCAGRAGAALARHRRELERYIREFPAFLASLEPIDVHPKAPDIVRAMARAARAAAVGPMAAVAGALAEAVGRSLLGLSREVIVENGGDLFLLIRRERIVRLDAGPSVFGRSLGLRVRPEAGPLGIATSSGTVGGSLSFGRADAACVLARTGALADAAATAVANVVRGPEDVEGGIARARSIAGVLGVVVVAGGRLGAWGAVELVEL